MLLPAAADQEVAASGGHLDIQELCGHGLAVPIGVLRDDDDGAARLQRSRGALRKISAIRYREK